MSLLPRAPSSRGLRPRSAALRSSSAGLRSARLPRIGEGCSLPQTPSPRRNRASFLYSNSSHSMSTDSREGHRRGSAEYGIAADSSDRPMRRCGTYCNRWRAEESTSVDEASPSSLLSEWWLKGQRKSVTPRARRHLFALGSGTWPGCMLGSVWCGAAISDACSRHSRFVAVPATRRVRDRERVAESVE